MCGRFTITQTIDQLKLQFSADKVTDEAADAVATARYNVAPTQPIPVIVPQAFGGSRTLDEFRWGLVPFWAKDTSIGSKMINARAESLVAKPAFRDAFHRRRCIIPASGFYEWDKLGQIGAIKQPYYFVPAVSDSNAAPAFGFAGLWETWNHTPDGVPLHSCTIVTTAANQTVGAIHDRMPAILDADGVDQWLDPTITDIDQLRDLLRPYPDDRMRSIPVSRRVNTVVNDDSGLIEPVLNSK